MIDWKKVARIQKEDAFLLEEDRKALKRRCICIQANVSSAIKALRPLAKESGGSIRKFNKMPGVAGPVEKFAGFYGLGSDRHDEIRNMLAANLFSGTTQKDVCEKMYSRLQAWETDLYISEKRGDMFPDFVYSFLPSNVSVRTIGQQFKRVVQHFVEMKRNSINVKMYVSSCLERDFSRLRSKMLRMFRSGDKSVRMAAGMVLITMDTGIRPGVKVGKVPVHGDEESSEIETFGLTTLRKEHFSFTDDGSCVLNFKGKKGTDNIFTVNDEELVDFLRRQFLSEGEMFEVDGVKADYDYLFKFLVDNVGYMASDFRKRVANITLYSELSKYKDGDDVERFLSEVYSNVAVALNHKTSDGSVAVNSYCNPKILLHWLSGDGCSFDEAVSENPFEIKYRR